MLNKIRKELILLILAAPSSSAFPFSTTLKASRAISSMSASATDMNEKEYYRADGVRVDFDPYAPGMAEKYGLPGNTDNDGFDPYADTVGAGIYGGSVQRDADGKIIIGAQYQNHNSRHGPVYDGKGYSLMSKAIQAGPEKVREVLQDFDEWKDEISTGGARPLHVCGMSQKGQFSTQVLIDAGADIHALDTYNYNALHRMASNNLDVGAECLVRAGLDPNYRPPDSNSSPIDIAKSSRAIKFLMAMQRLGHYD